MIVIGLGISGHTVSFQDKRQTIGAKKPQGRLAHATFGETHLEKTACQAGAGAIRVRKRNAGTVRSSRRPQMGSAQTCQIRSIIRDLLKDSTFRLQYSVKKECCPEDLYFHLQRLNQQLFFPIACQARQVSVGLSLRFSQCLGGVCAS